MTDTTPSVTLSLLTNSRNSQLRRIFYKHPNWIAAGIFISVTLAAVFSSMYLLSYETNTTAEIDQLERVLNLEGINDVPENAGKTQYQISEKRFYVGLSEIWRYSIIALWGIVNSILIAGFYNLHRQRKERYFETEKLNERYLASLRCRPDLDEGLSKDIPAILCCDIDEVITPPLREKASLIEFDRIRAYSEYALASSNLPPLILVTPRDQGYVELVCQSLGLMYGGTEDDPTGYIPDVACVIENGCAIYFPQKKFTVDIIEKNDLKDLNDLRKILEDEFREHYEFEPKAYMITINPAKQYHNGDKYDEALSKLEEEIKEFIKNKSSISAADFTIASTRNAVDIFPNDTSKLAGLKGAILQTIEDMPEIRSLKKRSNTFNELNKLRNKTKKESDKNEKLAIVESFIENKVAFLGSSEADVPLLRACGRKRRYIPKDSILEYPRDIKANRLERAAGSCVSEFIGKVTGLKLLPSE